MSDERDEEETEIQPDLPNAADPVAISRRQTEAALRSDQVVEFWRRCLADPVGRMVLWGLLMDCHAFEERFATTPTGMAYSEAAWFAAGEREVGQRLWRTLIGADHEGVLKMHQEFDSLALPRRRHRGAPRR